VTDIIEEIIAEEIIDETDRYEDNHSKKRARRTKDAAVMRGCVSRLCYENAYLILFFTQHH
jgi:metal transporter CNNM